MLRPSCQELLVNPINIVKYHDMNRATFIEKLTEMATDRRAAAGSVTGQRTGQIRGSPLSVAQGIPCSLPTSRQVRETDRAVRPTLSLFLLVTSLPGFTSVFMHFSTEKVSLF
jgi:hypothetical protein